MNLGFLSLVFLFIRSSYEGCTFQDFKLPLESNDCVCSDLSPSPMGRIYNGTDLDRHDLLYVAAIYGEYIKVKNCQLHLRENFIIIFF